MLNRPYCVAKAEVCRLCQSLAVESTPEGREPTTRLSRSEFSDSTVLPPTSPAYASDARD
eukprot:5081249-Amphidinium_carterae.1